jgi:hypothetical protein
MKTLTTEECLAAIPHAFLHFVRDECLWAFAPDKFMRWRPAKTSGAVRWEEFPFVWDFGSRVVVPELWHGWLPELFHAKVRSTKVPVGLMSLEVGNGKEEARLRIEGTVPPRTRRVLQTSPEHYFRGRTIFCNFKGSSLVEVWGITVGQIPQMNPRRDDEGNAVPWNAWTYFDEEEEMPINLKFDVCSPDQFMSIDVENTGDVPVDAAFEIPGVQMRAAKTP